MLRNRSGFTLIEVMVVIVILAVLAAIVMPKIIGRTDEAKVTATKIQIKNIEESLNLYKLDNGLYPTTEQGLEALVNKPSSGDIPQNWPAGGYMKKVPNDPWGKPFIYLSPGSNSPFEIISYAADGEEGGEGIDADINSVLMD